MTVTPEDSGDNGATPGHLWTSGSATVHIPCWFDSHVNFSGPIFIDTTLDQSNNMCTLTFQARAGNFNIGQNCCTVFEDLIVPIVGWIMLAVTQNMISSVGGSLASQIAAGQTSILHPIPPVVNGIAQVSACLTSLNIFTAGFVFPGTITIVRLSHEFPGSAGDHAACQGRSSYYESKEREMAVNQGFVQKIEVNRGGQVTATAHPDERRHRRSIPFRISTAIRSVLTSACPSSRCCATP